MIDYTKRTQYQILTNLSCNLDCHYCYEKKDKRVNKFSDVRDFLDILMQRDKDKFDVLDIDFIGGEPFLAIDLIEKITRYVLQNCTKFGFKRACFGFSTNATLLNTKRVKTYLNDYKDDIFLGISIDGIKQSHDTHRIYRNSRKGSYDDVVSGLKTALKILGSDHISVKATYTTTTLKDYEKGVKNIFNLGVKDVTANVVFEQDFSPKFAKTYLIDMLNLMDFLAEKIIKGEKIKFSFIVADDKVLQVAHDTSKISQFHRIESNWCGTCTHMICLGFDRKFYGCNRFLTMAKDKMELGYIDENNKLVYTNDKLLNDVKNQHKIILDDECKKCPIQSHCSACVAIAFETPQLSASQIHKRQCGWTYLKAISMRYLDQITKAKNA